MIAADLNEQQVLDSDHKAIQQLNFAENLDRLGNRRRFFLLEKSKETILNFSQGIVKVLEMCSIK